MNTLGLTLYLPEKQPAQWTNHPFSSLTTIAGQVVAAGSDGLYVLGEDEDDNGTDIDSRIEFPKTTLGAQPSKWIKRVDVYLKGDVNVTYYFEDEIPVYWRLPPESDAWEWRIIPSHRAIRGHIFNFILENVDGNDFALDQILLTTVELTR